MRDKEATEAARRSEQCSRQPSTAIDNSSVESSRNQRNAQLGIVVDDTLAVDCLFRANDVSRVEHEDVSAEFFEDASWRLSDGQRG